MIWSITSYDSSSVHARDIASANLVNKRKYLYLLQSVGTIISTRLTIVNRLRFLVIINLRSGVLFSGGAQKCGSARVEGRERKERTPDTITAQVCRQSMPESGLLSKNKRFFEPRSNWLRDWMFDFRCNLQIRNHD